MTQVSFAQLRVQLAHQPFLNQSDLTMELIESSLDYFNKFYMRLPLKTICKLQPAYNAAAYLLASMMSGQHIMLLLYQLYWLRVCFWE